MVNDKQLTIIWHVYYLKVSHVDENVVTYFINWLEEKYGRPRITRGKRHDSLGMTRVFLMPGKVQINMINYTKEAVESYPRLITGDAASPKADHLFMVREKKNHLNKKRAHTFHN